MDPGEMCLFGRLELVGSATPFAVADFDGDKNPDLAINSNNRLEIHRGSGTGQFQPPEDSIHIGSGPASSAAADLDGDGDLDIVLANFTEHYVRILRNNGDADFIEHLLVEQGPGLRSVAVGDVNDDGLLDVVIGDYGFHVLLNQGGLQFAGAVPTEAVGGHQILLLNLDGDSYLDIALSDWFSGQIRLYRGVGDGTFTSISPLVLGGQPAAMASGDFNEDCIADLAVLDDDYLTILLGDGDGSFTSNDQFEFLSEPIALAASDMDGDGHLDLAVTQYIASTIHDDVFLFKGDGEGGFAAGPVLPAGDRPTGLFVTDIDTDGDIDILVPNQMGTTVALNSPSGFTPAPPRTFPDVTYRIGAIGDLNGDGASDIVSVGSGNDGDDLRVDIRTNTDGFTTTFQASPGFVTAIELGYFDDDAVPDIVVALPDMDAVGVFLGNGDGTFAVMQPSPAYRAKQFAPGDFDGDDVVDLVVANDVAGLRMLIGAGDGTFSDAGTFDASSFTGDVAVGHFNSDQNLDVAVSDFFYQKVHILLGAGDGQLGSPTSYDVDGAVDSLAVWDVDGDDHLDIVSAHDHVHLFRGQGDGTFQDPIVLAPDVSGRIAALADVDNDSVLDIVVHASGAVEYTVMPGLGGTTFASPVHFAIPESFSFLYAEDLNSDGLTDVVAGGFGLTVVLASP